MNTPQAHPISSQHHRDIRIEDYDYILPDERIASYPLTDRAECQLLVYDRTGQIISDTFRHLTDHIAADALLVLNDTRVIRARLSFRRTTGSRIEVFCLDPVQPVTYETALGAEHTCTWTCMVGHAKKWREEYLQIDLPDGSALRAYREAYHSDTQVYQIRFVWDGSHTFGELLDLLGELPIPPYLKRATEASDHESYQTVYALHEGSVAAPTAGLHFTPALLEELSQYGIQIARLTLHVGAGTFKPVKSETMGGHRMHSEVIQVQLTTLLQLQEHLQHGHPIVAVGTTSTRTLESLYYMGVHLLEDHPTPFSVAQWEPYDRSYEGISTPQALQALIDYLTEHQLHTLSGETRIIIEPGFEYRIIDQLITNFHQPHSTLLLLVAALIGSDWRTVYQYAMEHGYRFLSYGDASLLSRRGSKHP